MPKYCYVSSAFDRYLKISSIINFVLPYGFVAEREESSVIRTLYGYPYTVANELNTRFFALNFFISLHELIVLLKIFAMFHINLISYHFIF